MSSSMLKGKTKSDLIEIALLSGLLTKTQTNRMNKGEILAVLLEAEEDHAGQAVVADTVSKTEGPASPDSAGKQLDLDRVKSKETANRKEAQQEAEAGNGLAETKVKPKRRPGRPRKQQNSDQSDKKDAPTTSTQTQSSKQSQNKDKSHDHTDIVLNKIQKQMGGSLLADQPDNVVGEVKEFYLGGGEVETKASNGRRRKNKNLKQDDQSNHEKALNMVAESVSEYEIEESREQSLDTYLTKQEERSDDHRKTDERQEEQEVVSGILEIMPDNYGFLRVENYLQSPNDIYIPPQFIRRFNLRNGDKVEGPARVQRDTDRYRALTYIYKVNDLPPDQAIKRPRFDRLTPIYPNEKYKLETHPKELATRMIDLISPIGKGQRGMIVSPPKAGKTILLQKIANAISINSPESKLFVLLIDERPEEVTDMQRSINGEVVYSTFDKTPENHVKVTELVLARAMRLVEMGQDVVILLDSITRMSRAYNLTINPTGRTLSGGLDPGALHGPKRFFGAARNIEHGGSLTIIATALVETGSRMDEVIFEEFKGTGNMEVVLDRKLAEKRVFPAIDLNRSSTRREDLLMTPEELNTVWAMRKAFANMETITVTETMISLLLKTKNNKQFAGSISISLKDQDLFEAMRGMMPKTGDSQSNANGAGGASGNNSSSGGRNAY